MTMATNWSLVFFPALFMAAILIRLDSVNAVCELSYRDHNKLYNYSLASPLHKFPHGVLSEDGFYKVAVNQTVLWFQLCDLMLFNHDPPACVGCEDCGGSSHCGMGCSALASNIVGGYPVCNSIGDVTSTTVQPMDTSQPHTGVIVTMSNGHPRMNCSLSVAVVCDNSGFQGPQTIEKSGICNYATQLRHPAGCAKVISSGASGWGWFGSLLLILLCLFAAYLIVGIIYRHFFLNIQGIDMIPNLEFWTSLPHQIQSSVMSLVRRYRGPSEGYRSSYSPVDF